MKKREYVVDGSSFSTLEEFAAHFSATVLTGYAWKGNLDAFNDILRGGFGTPDDGFKIVWRHHAISRERLGHAERARRLEDIVAGCHPSNRVRIASELMQARRGEGPTLFDDLVEIIRIHGPGGDEEEDGVELVLD